MKLKYGWVVVLTFPFCFSVFAEENNNAEIFSCANASTVMECIEKNTLDASNTTAKKPLTFDQPALSALFALAVRYDDALGWIPGLSYTQMFYNSGLHFQANYGLNEKRVNVTLGEALTSEQQIKITYEYLTQNNPSWSSQNAFGVVYRYLFDSPALYSFNINEYYVRANNTQNTAFAGMTFTPLWQTFLTFEAGYSHFSPVGGSVAYHIALKHLLTRMTQLSAELMNDAAETNSVVKLSQILPGHLEIALKGEYEQGHEGVPNSVNLTAALSYPVDAYILNKNDLLGALKAWVQKPAIEELRVLNINND